MTAALIGLAKSSLSLSLSLLSLTLTSRRQARICRIDDTRAHTVLQTVSKHHYTVSQKTFHLWIAITLRHGNGFWYFLAEMLLIEQAIKNILLCHLRWLVLLHYLVKRRNTKIAFSLKCCISALPEFNQLLDFFNLFDLRLILTMLYDSLNHVINAFSPQGFWGTYFRKRKVVSAAWVGLCCMPSALVRCLLGFLFRKVMQKH